MWVRVPPPELDRLLVAALVAVALAGCGAAATSRRPAPLLPPKYRAHRSAPDLAVSLRGLSGRRARARLLALLRHDVDADAHARRRAREISGPLHGVDCSVAKDDRELARRRPDAPVLRYECLALSVPPSGGLHMEIGTPFIARVDFRARRYAWCLYVPVGGEGAHTASTFSHPPAAACAGPP